MLQDLEEDRKEHTFNAILLHEDEDSAISRVKALLIMHITEAEALCELLPYTDNMAIIQNIVANGLPRQMLDAGILL